MSDDGSELPYFILGFVIALIIVITVSENKDDRFERIEERYKNSVQICKYVNSEPLSADTKHITCKNGFVATWKTPYKQTGRNNENFVK